MIKAIEHGLKPKRQSNYIQEIQKRLEKESNQLLFLTFLHLPLGIVLYNSGVLGILHTFIVFAFGMYLAIAKKIGLDRVAYLTAYLVCSEILWRMSQTTVFWEFGKYGASAIMIVALIRRRKFKMPFLPTVFIVLLIPAVLITFLTSDLEEVREKISFNLSGPFFLFISCWFFSNLKLDRLQIKKLFIVLFIPLLTVATTTLFYTVSNNVTFNTESNAATSGGYGPNQVSAMLGLGVFVGLACYLLYNNDLKFKVYFAIGALFLAAQGVLTFSRGGIYNAVGAIIILVVFQLQNLTQTAKKIVPFILVFVVFLILIFPFLDDFTGGKLLERFEDTNTSGRIDLIEADFEILSENPFLGVGLGNSKEYRESIVHKGLTSHTEFSRLISEHGLFGVIAVLVLILIAVQCFLKQETIFGRALIAGMVAWCCLFMFNAGMRLAAPSFLWGLCFVNIVGFQLEQRKNSLKNKDKLM